MAKEKLTAGIQRIISGALGVSKSTVNQVNCGIRKNAEVARLLELAKTDMKEFMSQIKLAKERTDQMNELYELTGTPVPYKYVNRRKKADRLEANTKNVSSYEPSPANVS
jgi:transcriptional regulator with XRE-family HTH domain